MHGLIPEKRRDKNGRMVTRHVRAMGPLQAFKAFPAPSAPQTLDSAEGEWAAAGRVAALIFPGTGAHEPLLTVTGAEQHDFGFEEAQEALAGMLGAQELDRIAASLQSVPEGSRARRLMAATLYPEVEERAITADLGERPRRFGPLLDSEAAGVFDSIAIAAAVDEFAGPAVPDDDLLSHMYNAARSVWRETTANGGQRWNGVVPGEQGHRMLVFSEFLTSFVAGDRIGYSGGRDAREVFADRMLMVENSRRIRRHQEVLRERGRIDVALLDELDRMSPAIAVGAL